MKIPHMDPSRIEGMPEGVFRILTPTWLGALVSSGFAKHLTLIRAVDENLRMQKPGSPIPALWRSMIAREVLLAVTGLPGERDEIITALPDFLLDTLPFPESSHSLKVFLELNARASACLFPLAVDEEEGKQPEVPFGQIWLVGNSPKDNDAEPEGMVANAEQLLLQNKGPRWRPYFCVDDSISNTRGDSWGLAWSLCERCLKQTSNQSIVIDLAKNWLVTGIVKENRRTARVEGIKAKARTHRNLASHRKILVPSANYPDWPGELKSVYFAEYLDTAWNWVEGTGIKDGAPVQWPAAGVAELHQLVGGFPGVNIALPLLFKTERVFLWVTENEKLSREPARVIAATLKQSIGLAPEDVEIDHRSMALAEQQLREKLEPTLQSNQIVVLNITSGNRLMSFAAHGLARRFPNLWLLYKEIDSSAITRIIYEGDYPSSSPLSLPKHPFRKKTPYADMALGKNIRCRTPEEWYALVNEGINPEKSSPTAFST
jgi:hypothetical protein